MSIAWLDRAMDKLHEEGIKVILADHVAHRLFCITWVGIDKNSQTCKGTGCYFLLAGTKLFAKLF